MLKLVSWNMNRKPLWGELSLGQEIPFDVALVQEAVPPSDSAVLDVVPPAAEPWSTQGWKTRTFRTAIASLSRGVTLVSHMQTPGHKARQGAMEVSRFGTLTLADVLVDGSFALTAASAYGAWESSEKREDLIYADASVHRILSDLAQLVTSREGHRIIVAGDLNILYGYGEYGDEYWADRYRTVFDRAAAMGLVFKGPQFPHGRQADPWPEELPRGSKNVPTFHHNRQTPATASRQLDFVFASETIANNVDTCALNRVDQWGSSDHCRVAITVHL